MEIEDAKLDSYNADGAISKSDRNSSIQGELRKSNTFCDATILLEDGGRIPVHRIILCNACDYFYKLFVSPISSEQGNNYHIKYIRTEIMQCIIEFAYTSHCEINEMNLPELIYTAEYFCFSSLVNYCADFISIILNPKNCIALMQTTRKCLYNHEIQRVIKEYILRNFLEIAATNEDLLSLSCNDLLDIINDDALNTKCEEPVWELCVRWIQTDEQNRIKKFPEILEGVRLGLLKEEYLEQRVLNHNYIQMSPEAQKIVTRAYRFVSDFDAIDWMKNSDQDLSLLVPRLPYDILFAIGGWFEGSACSLFEVYDCRADRWIKFNYGDPHGPRAYHSSVVIGNHIYCIGGYSGSEYYNRCTMFDLDTKTWKEIAPMHHRRCYVSVCLVNNRIYAMGGHNGHSRLRTTEVYNPETNQWTLLANMNTRRSDADACAVNGKVFILGGFDGNSCLRSGEMYDTETNEWSYIPDMQNARSGLKCCVYNGIIHAIGGYNGSNRLSSCETFNPSQDFWSLIHDMDSPRSNFGIEVIDDEIFVVGGFDGLSTIDKVESYKTDENRWRSAAGMTNTRSAHSLAKVSNIKNTEDFVYESRVGFFDGREVV